MEQEKGETFEPEQMQLKEFYYNCTKCSSPIEVLSINGKEYTTTKRCQ